MNLVESVFAAARRLDRWSHTAIVCDGRRIGYAELLTMVRRFGGLLRGLGVGAGQRIAIVAETVEAIHARLASLLPSYKCPVRVNVVAEMPRTATGKLQRFALRGQVID